MLIQSTWKANFQLPALWSLKHSWSWARSTEEARSPASSCSLPRRTSLSSARCSCLVKASRHFLSQAASPEPPGPRSAPGKETAHFWRKLSQEAPIEQERWMKNCQTPSVCSWDSVASSGARPLQFKLWHPLLPSYVAFGTLLNLSCLTFLICKVQIITVPTSWGCARI